MYVGVELFYGVLVDVFDFVDGVFVGVGVVYFEFGVGEDLDEIEGNCVCD